MDVFGHAMIFERLADVILKRSKLIIALWIILLICAAPFIMKVGEIMDYDGTNMAGPDSESIMGANIIGEYFKAPEISMEDAVLYVVNFNSPSEKTQAVDLELVLTDGMEHYRDSEGHKKIIQVVLFGTFVDSSDINKGVAIYALIYDEDLLNTAEITADTEDLRNYLDQLLEENGDSNLTTYVTGSPAISYDTEKGSSEDIAKIDPFTILLILILVGLFFRSFVTSAMPPLTIGVAFGVVMCLMYLVGSVLDIFFITEMFLLVSMLGAGCDYCIFILARYREERLNGNEHKKALRSSIIWAGESITTSGIAVMIGFGAMSICSFSMISTMGIMLALGILVALLAALTLITSVLAVVGDKIFWPSKIEMFQEGGKAMNGWYGKVSRAGHNYFVKSVRFSMKNAKAIVIAAIIITIPAVYITATADSSYDMVGSMSSGEAIQGLNEIEEYSNGGMIMPNYVVLEMADAFGEVTIDETYGIKLNIIEWTGASYLQDYLNSLSTLSSSILEDDNVGEIWEVYVWKTLVDAAVATTPQPPSMTDHDYAMMIFMEVAKGLPNTIGMGVMQALEFIDGIPMLTYDNLVVAGFMDYLVNYDIATSVGGVTQDDGTVVLTYVKLTVITNEEATSDRSIDTISYIDTVVTKFESDPLYKDIVSNVWLTGTAVVMYEVSEQVSGEFLKVEIIAIALIFVLLFFVMRSFVTPLRSIATILMSVAWTIGITHLIFDNLLGEGVIWMIPIILVVICLGLGMDYDILLTTRIRENHVHRGMTNDDAITSAVTHTGSVITICGLIMGGAFGTLMLSSTTMLQEFGFALCFAIIVDALIVRTYIVPAAMHLLGEWNWKGPKFLQRKNPE